MSHVIINVNIDNKARSKPLKFDTTVSYEHVKKCLYEQYDDVNLSIYRISDDLTFGPNSELTNGEYQCDCNRKQHGPPGDLILI